MGCVPCNQKWQVPMKKAAAGAVGLAKAAAGIDRVDDAALMARLEACGRCAELRRLVRGVAAGELPGLSDSGKLPRRALGAHRWRRISAKSA